MPDDLIEWLRSEIRADVAGAQLMLAEGRNRRWWDRHRPIYPADIINRGEAELAILDRCLNVIGSPETYNDVARAFAEDVIDDVASGYKRRAGLPARPDKPPHRPPPSRR